MKYHPSKKLKIIFFPTLFFFMPHSASAQLFKILPDGLGIEIGLGHNQLFWEAEDMDGSTVSADRTAFSVMPSARIHYMMSVTSYAGIYSFFGYNEFAGRSKERLQPAFTDAEVLYKDRIRFQNLEAGIFGLYHVSAFSAGLGAKVSHHLKNDEPFSFSKLSLRARRMEYF